MTWAFTPLAVPLLLIAALQPAIALWVFRFRGAPALPAILLILGGTAIWSGCYGLELLGADLDTKVYWANLKYMGIVLMPLGWFLFGLEYSGRSHILTLRSLPLLMIHPVATVLLLWTNDMHQLMWTNVHLDSSGPLAMIGGGYGVAFIAHTVYSYLLLLVGSVMLLGVANSQTSTYRAQAVLLLAAVLLPWVANTLFFVGLTPLPSLDITAYAIGLSALVLVVAVARFGLLDITPVARNVLVETMSDLVLVLDANNRIVDINTAAQQVLSLDQTTMVGAKPADALGHFPLLQDALAAPQEASAMALTLVEDELILELNVTALRNNGAQLSGWLVVMRDITERRRTEAIIREYAAELEAHNSELDAYAHTVAHDLKNPLNLISAYSDMMNLAIDAERPDEVLMFAGQITQATEKMQQIIDGLLLLANLRTNKQVPVAELDMTAIVDSALLQMSQVAAKRKAVLNAPTDWPTVLGYAPWVEEVWINYLSNAIKYGGNPPEVTLGVSERDDGMACFWVRDNGAGLKNGDSAKLFKEFTRLEDVGKIKGDGLGLSIVHRIVTRLNGTVGVESEPGNGCLFWFTLPQA